MAKQIEIPKPTKVPDNWCWVAMGKLTSMKSGYPFDSHRFVNEPSNTTRPLIRIRDVIRGTTETFTDEECPDEYIITRGEILIGMDGDFNVAKWQSADALLNQRVCCIKSSCDLFLDDFLFYYLPDPLKKINDATPSVTVKHLSTKTLAVTPVPVPPLAEQRRIVDRIEYLFAKLDEAKEQAQSALDSFDTRKAAILHKAFTGELTAKWREANGVSYDTWELKKLDDVCNSIFDGDHMPPPKSEIGIPFLVISNVNTGFLSFDNTRFVPQEYYDSLTETRKPEKGDVLYTLVGSYGIPVVVDSDNPFCFQRHMALLKPDTIDTRCLWYLLQTQEMFQKASAIAKGVAQLTVPIKGLRAMDFLCPSPEEQLEIVSILDSLFAKEQQAKEAAEAVLEKIDLLKKSILARAFRGELGTNDPAEESALELLKTVL